MSGPVLAALAEVLQLQNIIATMTGVIFGLFIGSTPGLTISLGMVLLLPVTFGLSPVTAVCLLLGLYASGMTGGSISAVLLNIPGTPSAAATAIDGHKLARKGRAGEALGIAVISSFFGGLIGLACLTTASPFIAEIALKFGAPELFALVLMGLTLICGLGRGSVIKALISGVLGLIIMTAGLDPMIGSPRFTFGMVELQAGVSFLPAMIGLFAIPQLILGVTGKISDAPRRGSGGAGITGILPRIRDLARLAKAMLLGAVFGTGVGAIPGAGGPIAVFLSYNYAKRISRRSDNFGKGEIEGVAAPEAANNAVAGGALIPMLTLGIPGDPITAILLGALVVQGLTPGPLLFVESSQFVYSVFWAFLLANVMNLLLTLATIRLWVKVLQTPHRILMPIILVLCVVGSYSLRNTFFDTGVMLVFGLLAYIMRKYNYPIVPMLLAIILGPQLEEHLRMSLIISQGDPTIFITRPISLVFIVIAVLTFTLPLVRSARKKKNH